MSYIQYESDGHVIATYDFEPTSIGKYIEVDVPDGMECFAVDFSNIEPIPLFREVSQEIPSEEEPFSDVDLIYDILADQEYRLCLIELGLI